MEKELETRIGKLLETDPLSEAEKLTGKSYKEDKVTESLGFLMMLSIKEEKENLLTSVDDTTFSETEGEYLRKVTDLGFELLLKETFIGRGYGNTPTEEHFYIMFHREYSILLSWDTFVGKRNGGNFYYNWSPNESFGGHSYRGSGGYVSSIRDIFSLYYNKDFTNHDFTDFSKTFGDEPRWVLHEDYEVFRKISDEWHNKLNDYVKLHDLRIIWRGGNDCREAIKYTINGLAANGTFLKKWKEQPFMWLLHHGEKNNKPDNYKEINEMKISKFPLDIQEIIKGEIFT